jgi:hypothetical protein
MSADIYFVYISGSDHALVIISVVCIHVGAFIFHYTYTINRHLFLSFSASSDSHPFNIRTDLVYSVISAVPAVRTAKIGRCFVASRFSSANEGLDQHPRTTRVKAATMAPTRLPWHHNQPPTSPRVKFIAITLLIQPRYLPCPLMATLAHSMQALPAAHTPPPD